MSDEIKIGDKVEVINHDYESEHYTVNGFVHSETHDSVATFEEGGFWRISQLRKVVQ